MGRAHAGRNDGAAWSTLGGICAALLLAEALLQPWSISLTRFNVRPISEDGLRAPVITVRNYQEGIATSHFTPSRARLTGIAPVPDAPYVLIVGDSFVAEEQIPDQKTMGAQLEELSARQGERINVRQYGWIAAAPAKYIVEAPDLLKKWQPALSVVILNFDDFVPEALHDGWTTMKITPGAPAVIKRVDPNMQSRLHALSAKLTTGSGLLQAMLSRFALDVLPALRDTFWHIHLTHAASAQATATAPSAQERIWASVSELHRAFGDRLLLVYAGEPGLDNIPDGTEKTLLEDCRRQNVQCYSTRADFIRARDSGQFLAAGFSNSKPGAGHYNADGESLIAQEIWRDYENICPEKR